jgi:nitrite reductase/ring-hydroxylating ferredoxin subunit
MLSSKLRLLCSASEVQPGTAKRIVVGGLALAAFNLDGEFYVTDDTCTHGFASLSEGIVDGHIIECPWHGGTFDIRSGAPIDHPCTVPLNTYQTVVKDGAVWIDMNESVEDRMNSQPGE